jgi:hypothetical protein
VSELQSWQNRVIDMVNDHERMLYKGGDGKPGISSRMDRAEDSLAAIKFYARWLMVLVGGILATAVVNLILKH